MGWNAHLSPEPYQFFSSKFSRYHVGGIHESLEFQILTGVLVRGENIFWNIFISIAVVISGISMASLTLKQLVESFRDHRILHKVCINHTACRFLWISRRPGTLNWKQLVFLLSKILYKKCGILMVASHYQFRLALWHQKY